MPEIDITDPKNLAKARIELTRMLEIVEFAISKYNGNSDGRHQANLAIRVPSESSPAIQEADLSVAEVINRLPKKFSTTDVVLAFGDEGKEMRSRIKLALKRAVDGGNLILSKRGVGRRPSEYEKTTLQAG